MPWRSNPLPYYVWVSETMLQQTQVSTVIPYFNRFIQKFPTIQDLANADQQTVLKQWEGLGYYSRARNVHKAAQYVINELNDKIPSTYEKLQELPGIGPYIAAAIASIAFEVPVPVVDGNVLRVFSRFWGISDDIRNTSVRNTLFDQLTPIIKKVKEPSQFNQAIMELGALICTPKSPTCNSCPIATQCYANTHHKQAELPYKSKSKPTPHYDIAVGIIRDGNKILIGKRKQDQMLGGLWEFPGGKQKESESLEETVMREIKEETGLQVKLNHKITQIKHAYTHFKITLHAYDCTYISGKALPHTTDEIRWVSLSELKTYPFPKANSKVLDIYTGGSKGE
jgi:A/G-specific adenine glycosylase